MTPQTRLERFRIRHRIPPTVWAAKAGLARQNFAHVRKGNDPHVATVRAIVRSASEILGRDIRASELFDLGESVPASGTPEERRIVRDAHRKALRRYTTRLDRILRGEQIMPDDFARRVGILRQSLLRFRSGRGQPCLSTLARMVTTLRKMTGKPYTAAHLYDVGEGLAELSPP